MKVLFVATVTEHITAFHLPYLRWFKEKGFEVHIAAWGDDVIPYCDKKHNVAIRRSPFKLGNIKAYFQLKNILKHEKFDIIHGHTPMGGILARLCGRKHRKHGMKVFYTAHGFHFFKGAPLLNWLLYYPIEKRLSRYTDVLITINREDYALAKRKMRAEKVCYVPGVGVDTDKFAAPSVDRETKRKELGLPLDAVVLISIGELNKNKNHQTAIKAVSRIQNDNLYYIICGRGKLQGKLQELCRQLKLEDRVMFLGYRKDIPELLNSSDIFVFPSLREGLSVSLMEAMAASLPCVVSKIRGNVDLIEDSKGGYLCGNIGDYTESIEKINQNMGEHNKNVIQNFGLAFVMEKMKEIYSEGLNGTNY